MMRKRLFPLALAGLFACAAAGAHAQQSSGGQSQSQPAPSASAPSSSNSSNAATSSGQSESLADVARKARATKQESQKPAKVIDNDNIPTTGGISSVGSSGDETAAASESSTASSASGSSYPDGKDEKGWRALFANLKHKLEQDQQLADVAQRELGVDSVQYYNDPMKTMMQEITRSDINKKTAEIDQKKKQVEADKQAISDAQEALRRADGDPGWAE